MNIIWGTLMILIGLFMFISSLMKSDFIIFRLLIARSKILWGDNVYRFYQVVSVIIIVVGVLMIMGIISR